MKGQRGFTKAQNKVNTMKAREAAIMRRYRRGERPRTHKKLAELMDRAYHTKYVENFHS